MKPEDAPEDLLSDRLDRWLGRVPKPLRRFLSDPPFLSGLVAGSVYAVVRVGYETFYGELGTTPDEVGITEVTAIAKAVEGLVFLMLFPAVGAFVGILLAGRFVYVTGKLSRWFQNIRGAGATNKPRMPDSFPYRPIIGVMVLIIGALYLIEPDLTKSGFGLIWIAGGILVLAPRRAYVRLGAVAMIALGCIVASIGYGDSLARNVKNGGDVEPGLVNSFFAIQAEPVCVAWIGPDRPPPGIDWSTSMVLLGTSNSEAVLYHARSSASTVAKTPQGVVRVPTSNVVIAPVDLGDYQGPVRCDTPGTP